MSYEIRGNQLFHEGQRLHLLGVNVVGMELSEGVVFGLGWAGLSIKDFVGMIRSCGFNAVRLPISPNTIRKTSTNLDMLADADKALKGKPAMEICDAFVKELEAQGIRFLLDHHYIENGIPPLWYTDKYSEGQWLEDLGFLARRYKGMRGFIGIDTKNEPNRSKATWGDGSKTDWKTACEKAERVILSANPDIIVMHEASSTDPGINEMVQKPIADSHIVNGTSKNKRSLSVHIYGPDVWQDFGEGFKDPSFPKNMPQVWDKIFGNVSVNENVIIGEWGGNFGRGWGKGNDVVWQQTFAEYLKRMSLSSFYWCFTADSWDTGGILEADRKTVRQDKLDMLSKLRTPYTTFLDEKAIPEYTPPPETTQEPPVIVINSPVPEAGDYRPDILRYFAFDHLPANLQEISAPFSHLAEGLYQKFKDGNEGEVALRKLLEAKDAAVRACL